MSAEFGVGSADLQIGCSGLQFAAVWRIVQQKVAAARHKLVQWNRSAIDHSEVREAHMDRQELMALMAAGPICIHMNDGKLYQVEHPSEAIVTDISAHVVYRDEGDGKTRAMVLPLETMSGVQPLGNSA